MMISVNIVYQIVQLHFMKQLSVQHFSEGKLSWGWFDFFCVNMKIFFIPPRQSEGGGLEILIAFAGKRRDLTCPSVRHLVFCHTSEARGLKIGMHIPHTDGFKFTNQIFDILSRS